MLGRYHLLIYFCYSALGFSGLAGIVFQIKIKVEFHWIRGKKHFLPGVNPSLLKMSFTSMPGVHPFISIAPLTLLILDGR